MTTRRAALGLLTLAPAAFALGVPTVARAAEPAVFQRGGLAIGGTDPVAYFTDREPTQGSADFTASWNGATWQFASSANRDQFLSDPERFAPAFGGYCAWAASRGYIAPTVPDAWTIYEGRLYLNANRRIRRRWEGELPTIIAQAEANWPGILG